MRHRATQLILPFEPALPGRQLILAEIVADDDADNTITAGEAGGTATPVNAGRSRRRRFDRGASHEHAAQFGKPGDDGASRQAGLYLRAPIDRRPSPSASGEHRAAVSAGRSCSLVRLAQGTD